MPDTGPKSFVVAYKMWMGRPSPHREKESITVRPNPLSASKLPINCMFIRAVHGSGRLGFGPDSNSTRLDRVIKNLTRNRPNNGSDPTVRVNS